jgi:hypothetical protein
MARHLTALILAASLSASCSLKPYQNTLEKNLYIRTETKSDSFLSTVRSAVDVYRIDASCRAQYEGTVELNSPSVFVGIPFGRPSYLVFNFASSSFLANTRSTISYDTLLTPRAGYIYDVKVNYIDNIYGVIVRETHPQGPLSREIERRDLSVCNRQQATE